MMGGVVEFRRPEPPHLAGEAVCLGCRRRWVSVAPVGVWQLECPECGTMKGIFTQPVGASEGDQVFVCDCGSEALTAYFRSGRFYFRCMSCGTDHTEAVFGAA